MITLVQRVLDDVRRHAAAEAPRECCGVLIGSAERILEAVPAVNLAEGTTRFQIDPHDHIRAMREARCRALDVVGFYHSHPRSPAYPSDTDIAESGYAGAVHLIVGVGAAGREARLFLIEGSGAKELGFVIVPSAAED
ncbi:MAG TPA: M67 family metallopeptidase [Vicinamibacterales bacterium]|nr:M67 family metallopeptidase [Vicinamibacterales bacterium]